MNAGQKIPTYSNFIHCQRIYKIRVPETLTGMIILFLFVFISTNIVFLEKGM